MHAPRTMTAAAIVTVPRMACSLPSLSSECNGQVAIYVETTAPAGGTLSSGAACCAPTSHRVSIAAGGPVYTSMSALPDRDRSGQARLDEPALVASALAGAREAPGTLVEWYAGSVRRVTRAILVDVADAEDAEHGGGRDALVKPGLECARRSYYVQ